MRTRRFRVGGGEPSQARRFRLPQAQRAAPAYEPKFEALTGPGYRDALVLPKPASPPAPAPVARAQVRRAGAYIVKAPRPAGKGRRVLEFVCATNRDMPAMFGGSIRLRCDRNAADLSRLEAGLMALAVDHNAENLMGRVIEVRISGGRITMSAEIGRSDYAARILAEIDDGLRVGFSPGFLVLEAEPLRNTGPAYDEEAFQVEITKHQIYEASSTAQPRNLDAVLLGMGGAQSMNVSTNMEVLGGPEIVHIDDEIGLALSTARVALRSGKGSKRQRVKLEAFIRTYDDLREQGQGRDAAAHAAREAAGLA